MLPQLSNNYELVNSLAGEIIDILDGVINCTCIIDEITCMVRLKQTFNKMT